MHHALFKKPHYWFREITIRQGKFRLAVFGRQGEATEEIPTTQDERVRNPR